MLTQSVVLATFFLGFQTLVSLLRFSFGLSLSEHGSPSLLQSSLQLRPVQLPLTTKKSIITIIQPLSVFHSNYTRSSAGVESGLME